MKPPLALPHLPAMELAESSELHELWNGHPLDLRQDLSIVNLRIASTVLTFHLQAYAYNVPTMIEAATLREEG